MAVAISSGKPYTEHDGVRRFTCDVNEMDLVWHRDKKRRTITVQEGQGWYIQFDNALPIQLNKGDRLVIPEMMYHRVLKGDNDLVIKIDEV